MKVSKRGAGDAGQNLKKKKKVTSKKYQHTHT